MNQNNNLAEALGLKLCKGCNEEITFIDPNDGYHRESNIWKCVAHSGSGYFWFSSFNSDWFDGHKTDHAAMTREEYEQ